MMLGGCAGAASDTGEPVDEETVAGDETEEDTSTSDPVRPECEGCVASTASCVVVAPHPREGGHPTQNLRCDPACCDGGQTFRGGITAICGCPAEVEARREPGWTPDQTATALGICVDERATNERVRELVESLGEGDRVALLQAALDESGVSDCGLVHVWSE